MNAQCLGRVLRVCLVMLLCGCSLQAADPAPVKPKDDLSLQQQQIRRDYERFERSLLEAAESLRRKEPEQSDILDRAREKSQEQALLGEMEKIALELKQNQTGSASDRQRQVIERMEEILQLLQSEDERDRLQREMERIQDLLKDTNRVIGKQRDAKATNQKGGDQKQAEDEQKKAAEEAKKLAQKIDKQDKSRKGESKPSDLKPGDPKDSPSGDPMEGDPKSPPNDDKPSEEKPKDGDKPKPGDDKPPMPKDPQEGAPMPPSDPSGKPKPGDAKPMPSQPMPGKPMPGQESPPSPPMPGSPMPGQPGQPMPPMPMDPQPPQDSPPPDDQQTEGRKDLQEAQDSMQKAIEDLEQKSRESAGEEQEKALKKLEELKAKLEEILRQRREEEKELYLAMLEVRFQKMLRVQLQVNAETTRLEKIPEMERNPAHFDKCSEAARQQRENQTDADKTLVLLKEEGSSVAFPEAVEQMRNNMELIAARLTRADTGDTTQLLEQLVVETLEEITLALQKEMEAQRQKKQQPPKKQQGQPQDQSLVNQLAELKMIRSLQNQVNRITKQIGVQIDGEQTGDPDQRKLTEDLSKRQQRIQSATYDLSTGRNK